MPTHRKSGTHAARPLTGNTARTTPVHPPNTVQAVSSCAMAEAGRTGIIAAGGAEGLTSVDASVESHVMALAA